MVHPLALYQDDLCECGLQDSRFLARAFRRQNHRIPLIFQQCGSFEIDEVSIGPDIPPELNGTYLLQYRHLNFHLKVLDPGSTILVGGWKCILLVEAGPLFTPLELSSAISTALSAV